MANYKRNQNYLEIKKPQDLPSLNCFEKSTKKLLSFTKKWNAFQLKGIELEQFANTNWKHRQTDRNLYLSTMIIKAMQFMGSSFRLNFFMKYTPVNVTRISDKIYDKICDKMCDKMCI